ncbi:MAG: Lrp/AsnC ligand binding domain-containing protein [Rubrivivax sp.]|nr:Lrp/AsnC ligand binding domain-containing protein [Rubrivivax sp.]
MRARTTQEHIRRYVDLFDTIPKVLDAVRVTGKDCFVVRWVFAVPAELERLVDALASQGSVTTALVPSHPLQRPPPVER